MSEIIQGSLEWHIQRLGKATASQFKRVQGGPSAWASYARELREGRALLKRLQAGDDVDIPMGYTNDAMAWGHKYEPMARSEFEFRNNVDIVVPSFIDHPTIPWCGCSPDGLVIGAEPRLGSSRQILGGWPEWLIEIKCPHSEAIHMETLARGFPAQHKPQTQGQMSICGTPMGTFISFDPRRDSVRRYKEIHMEIDEEYVESLESRIIAFLDFVDSADEVPRNHPDGRETGVPVLF